MEAEVIDKIKAMVEKSIGTLLEIDGKKYSACSLFRVDNIPMPKPIEISTLKGVAEYVNNTIDEKARETGKVFLFVESYKAVSLCENLNSEMLRRRFVEVKLQEIDGFAYEQWYDVERFLIALRAKFMQVPDRERLLEFCSKISGSDSLQTLDNGVSQSIEVKKGISGALKENQTAPSVVKLSPYRTFREVAQPASEFVFRMKGNSGAMPSCSLHEADGGAWKLEAVKNIAEWLQKNVKNITVIS